MGTWEGHRAMRGRILTLPPNPEGLNNCSPGSRSAPGGQRSPTRSANPGGVEHAESARQMAVVIPLPSSPRHRHGFRRPFAAAADSSSVHRVPVVIRNPAHKSLFNPSGVGGIFFFGPCPGVASQPGLVLFNPPGLEWIPPFWMDSPGYPSPSGGSVEMGPQCAREDE